MRIYDNCYRWCVHISFLKLYFRTIGAEITKYGVEIVLSNVYGNYWQSPALRSLSSSSLSLNFEVGGSKATGSQLAYVCALLNSFTFPHSKSFEVISERQSIENYCQCNT